jgi:hypothetical protein
MSTANNTVPLSDANMTLTDEGRVFTRLLRFRSFPDDLQADTKAFQAFVVQNKANVFQMHHTVRMKSVYSVKGKELIEHIEKWLQDRGTGVPVSAELHARARQIADSLVLSGFLTPLNDDEKHVNAPTPEHYVHNNELLIPVAEEVSALNTTSVWSVLEGASYAKVLKRKAGVRAHFSRAKTCTWCLTSGRRRRTCLSRTWRASPLWNSTAKVSMCSLTTPLSNLVCV